MKSKYLEFHSNFISFCLSWMELSQEFTVKIPTKPTTLECAVQSVDENGTTIWGAVGPTQDPFANKFQIRCPSIDYMFPSTSWPKPVPYYTIWEYSSCNLFCCKQQNLFQIMSLPDLSCP